MRLPVLVLAIAASVISAAVGCTAAVELEFAVESGGDPGGAVPPAAEDSR